MSGKVSSAFPYLILLSLLFLYLYSNYVSNGGNEARIVSPVCDLFHGRWELFRSPSPSMYDESCPFHRHAWNCLRNKRKNIDIINSYQWRPYDCSLERIEPHKFLNLMRNKNIGFVGDSLNENFLVAFLCALRVADGDAKRWKRKGAWKGAYFPNFNVTVGYHRAVLLANYEWQPKESSAIDDNRRGTYRVDVDIPAKEWINIKNFYDVLVFNTGHWWNEDKFPKETPLVFHRGGKPISPPLDMLSGLEIVLENMILYVEKEFPRRTLKFWRLQSPRHFQGGDWNQSGSCLFDEPLKEEELDMWFDARNNGVNKEARLLNRVIERKLKGRSFTVLDLTHLSEFRADAHPAIWLGKEDAVSVWGQDCMHWCLPGVPDTWVDILSEMITTAIKDR